MKIKNKLFKYFLDQGGKTFLEFSDGAIINPSSFPVSMVETKGAILFADLPGYSKKSEELSPSECAYFINHFFAWIEGEAVDRHGGIIDKFIGDEVMIIFPHTECEQSPIESAIYTAKAILENDPYEFEPKIGISSGEFTLSITGTVKTYDISAIGKTVNLAARCVSKTKGPNSIRIAIKDKNIISKIFNDYNVWDVSEIQDFEPKNMKNIEVVDIERKTKYLKNFNYKKILKKNIKMARDKGVIINNLNKESNKGN